ncbi:MAG TPA: hypothetical protein VKE42_01565, partial [Candidatus Cybelea sp.]|nr:hypothetical protein [Candidatus Cybelea sp.]
MSWEPPIRPSWERGFQRVFPWVVAALGFAVIAPALRSGWVGDDAFYSVLDGVLGADRTSLLSAMRHAFELWFFGNGRFYPLLILEKYLVFAVFTNLVAYKALLVAATLATVETFRRCVAAYTTRGFGNLCALTVVALLALRGYQDAILAYNAMPQLVAMLVLLSAIAFRRVLQRGGSRWGAASIGLYALAALSWEEAYAFSLLYVALAACTRRSPREALRLGAPFIAIAAALALVSLAARAHAGVPTYSTYGISFSGAPLLRTLGEQVLAALPLSYYLFDPSHIFGRSSYYDFYNNAPLNPLIFMAFLPPVAYALQDAASERIDAPAAAIIGMVVIALAAAPLAALVKYQQELRAGLGYLPVFYEGFGIALILGAVAVATMRQRARIAWQVTWSIALAALATMTQAANVRVVREDAARLQARASLEEALDRGLLARVPDGAAITMAPQDW